VRNRGPYQTKSGPAARAAGADVVAVCTAQEQVGLVVVIAPTDNTVPRTCRTVWIDAPWVARATDAIWLTGKTAVKRCKGE